MLQRNVLLVASILLFGVPQFVIASDSVDIEEIKVAGIKFSDDKDRVRELLGEPSESGPTCDGCIDIIDSWYIYDGIRVHFLQTEALQFEVNAEKYRLISGVGVGSSQEEVIKQYGQPETTPHEDNIVLAYPLTSNGRGHPDVKLEFLVHDDVVIGFQAGPTRTGSAY